MNTIYISESSKVQVDDNGNIVPLVADREAIRSIYLLKEPTKIVYQVRYRDENDKLVRATNTIDGDPGQILVCFYDETFEHPVILVGNEEWADNIRTYNKTVLGRLEEAASNADCEIAD